MSNAKNKAPKAPKATDPAAGLFGSNVQPTMVDINGTEVQLGDVVMHAFTASQLTAEEWNGLPEAEREEQIAADIEAMRAAPPAEKPKPTAKAELPESITLKRPHGFIDEDTGAHRYWQPGLVTNPDDIALLIERKAEIE